MASLGEQLIQHTDVIVQRWYEAWKGSRHPHLEVAEAALKDELAVQLRVIERLDPEARVDQEIPIEEVVQEYRIAVIAIREWMAERKIEVPFLDYSYFYQAIFELTAEAVRRYTEYNIEQVKQARSEYLAEIAHQLRAPLATMALVTEILEDPNRRADSNLIARLRASVARLSRLVDGVMRLERFKAEELPVRPVRTHIAELIDSVIAENELAASRKQLRFEVQLDRTLEMTIDPDLFIDVFGNLVQNAIKYTLRGFVRVEVEQRPHDVHFRVIDSGPGISPDRQASLFSPVQPEKAGGVGIGLTIAKRAVVAQEGTIGCASEPGRGSTFWFQLPRVVHARELT